MTTIEKTYSEVTETFSFLVEEYGFEIIETNTHSSYKGKYFIIYKNNPSNLQLEISFDDSYFHCEIRRLLNGQPAKYSDKNNCIGFESLAILESENTYDSFDYFAGGSKRLKTVITNIANLLKRHKAFLTTDTWVDTVKIEKLIGDSYFNKFGFRYDDNKNKQNYFAEIKKEASILLKIKGFTIILDSEELPPFDFNSNTKKIIFRRSSKTIIIKVKDWRDYYNIYCIEVDGKQVFEIDLSLNIEIVKAIELTLNELKKIV